MIQFKIEMDDNLKKWLRQGLPKAVNRSLIISAKETQKSVALNKQHILFSPRSFPSTTNPNFEFRIRHARSRLNLYKIPFRVRQVATTRKMKGRKKKIRMNQILTSVYGRPFVADPLNPFFIMFNDKNKGKYFYKGKPKKSETPIAMYRKTSARKPLATALAPSLSETLENTPGLLTTVERFAQDKWKDRISHNIDFFLNQISDAK